MIDSDIDSEKGQGRIVLCPNMSGHWHTTRLLLVIVSLLALIIATAFALLGLWLILPFTGLEVVALISLMYWVAHQCRRKQVITLADNRVLVEKGIDSPEVSWESDLFFTRLIVEKPPYRGGQPLKIYLRSQQQQVELGEFLNEDDKKKLITELRNVISIVS